MFITQVIGGIIILTRIGGMMEETEKAQGIVSKDFDPINPCLDEYS